MKQNEAIYRSPKWLRNIIDYEVNTGDDIKGQPSKRSLNNKWDDRWKNSVDKYSYMVFMMFFKKTYSYVELDSALNKQVEDIKNKFRGDFTILDKFDLYIVDFLKIKDKAEKDREKKDREKKDRKDREEKELRYIFDIVHSDFNKAPYDDKFYTSDTLVSKTFYYDLENGNLFSLIEHKDNKIDILFVDWLSSKINKEYILRDINSVKLKVLFRKIKKYIISGATKRPSNNNDYSYNSPPKKEPKKDKHPKKDTYDTLKKSIQLRKTQIKDMKTGAEKDAMENELKVAESMLKKMKSKYAFEHLKSFESFKII